MFNHDVNKKSTCALLASFSFEQLLLDSVGKIILCDAILEANVLSPQTDIGPSNNVEDYQKWRFPGSFFGWGGGIIMHRITWKSPTLF